MLFLALWHTVHPYGSRTSPGSIGAVPEVLFSEIEKVQVIPQTPNPQIREKLPPNEEDLSYSAPIHLAAGILVIRQFSLTKGKCDIVLLEMDTLR